ncbi:uncharacterized protein METZ01_LOCUS478113, partial [marine metagenome]
MIRHGLHLYMLGLVLGSSDLAACAWLLAPCGLQLGAFYSS